ncbi:HNHc domain containing protein [uncultured Caudovirales phage]|uniref:HNHc domain containing protein n=1 Tax=uncultured Caudovirales phage TaxID=2100421 RepID=A0A6J5NK39_9CAUD|nr:HNHc domain containing protein [uncultured Caudovirales phage]
MNQRRKMPSRGAIRSYWVERLCRGRRPVADSPDEIQNVWFCFACGQRGSKEGLERCHIRARVSGGEDTVQNLHLLCRYCHFASELFDGSDYWRWFARWGFVEKCSMVRVVYGKDLMRYVGETWAESKKGPAR